MQYVRGNFFAGEHFAGLADAQARAGAWCRQVAGLRVHGTIAARPAEDGPTSGVPARCDDRPERWALRREAYRALADYEWDMKELAKRNPDLVKLIKAALQGPDGKKNRVVVTYDEFGGQWDHVAPPGQGPNAAKGPHDQMGPGTRIPALSAASRPATR